MSGVAGVHDLAPRSDITRVKIFCVDTRDMRFIYAELPDGKLYYCELPGILSTYLIKYYWRRIETDKTGELTANVIFNGRYLKARPHPEYPEYLLWELEDES